MQPLTSSVDYESRLNSHRNDDVQDARVAEETPLLHRFPTVPATRTNPVTTVVVILLIIILLSGVIIGIYLLILQSRAENILPPVETPLQMVSRSQWDRSATPQLLPAPRMTSHVIVVQTDTDQCHSTTTCTKLLREMQNQTSASHSLPYNFMISSNGQAYETLGWRQSSPMFPEYSASALVLAFIGNFTETTPTSAQLMGANNFFAESVSKQYLSPSFDVFGKNTKESPKRLFLSLEKVAQWKKDLSDAY